MAARVALFFLGAFLIIVGAVGFWALFYMLGHETNLWFAQPGLLSVLASFAIGSFFVHRSTQ